MKPKVVLITGAPGVGKSAVASILLERLPESIWLDGDDVWRMNPFRVNGTTTAMVESNIQFVLRNFLSAGFAYVILSWVLHRQAIIDRILEGLAGLEYEPFLFTLVCEEEALKARLEDDPSRQGVTELALRRLRESRELETRKIDVTRRGTEEIVEEILREIAGEGDKGTNEAIRDGKGDR